MAHCSSGFDYATYDYVHLLFSRPKSSPRPLSSNKSSQTRAEFRQATPRLVDCPVRNERGLARLGDELLVRSSCQSIIQHSILLLRRSMSYLAGALQVYAIWL